MKSAPCHFCNAWQGQPSSFSGHLKARWPGPLCVGVGWTERKNCCALRSEGVRYGAKARPAHLESRRWHRCCSATAASTQHMGPLTVAEYDGWRLSSGNKERAFYIILCIPVFCLRALDGKLLSTDQLSYSPFSAFASISHANEMLCRPLRAVETCRWRGLSCCFMALFVFPFPS